jgi:hypothetical protein
MYFNNLDWRKTMRKHLLALSAIAAAATTTPAFGQTVSGDITITGSVAPKCLVVTGGTPAGSSFSGTIALGELADASGVLRSDIEASFNTAGDAIDIQVVCTTANPTASVDANPIVAQNVASPPTGYANTIDYQADITFDLTPTGNPVLSNDSEDPAGVATPLGGRLASGATNIHIAGSDFRTANATDILVADNDYEGHILITVAPGS